jgi:hypothetical protein
MKYKEFQRQLGKAGISICKFASIVKMNPHSITNCAKSDRIPSHLAIIATLMGVMADHKIDFQKELRKIKIEPKKPRGRASKGKFGGTTRNDLNSGKRR